MKKYYGFEMYRYLLVLFLGFAATFVSAVEREDDSEIKKSFAVSQGGTLELRVNPGEIDIFTWDKNEVLVKVEGIEEDEKESLRLEYHNNVVLVDFSSDWNWSDDVEFKITVPKIFNIELKTTGGEVTLHDNIIGDVRVNTGGGEISTKNITGEVILESSGGEIETGDITGNASITTMGGEIKTGAIKGKHAQIKTMGGDIALKSVEARLSLQTYGGDIKMGDLIGQATLKTFGGDIKLQNAPNGVDATTLGGNIKLNEVGKFVRAKTNGGNIIVKKVTGFVDLKTSAGRATVGLYPEGNTESFIRSGMGDLTLYLPADARVTIKAVVSMHGWHDDDEDMGIYCEFESKVTMEEKNGSKFYKTMEINGGGQVVNLKAVNSDIKIKKIK